MSTKSFYLDFLLLRDVACVSYVNAASVSVGINVSVGIGHLLTAATELIIRT